MSPNTFRLVAISFVMQCALGTLAQSPSTSSRATQRSPEERELVTVVERFLELAGKRDHEGMRSMLAPAANVGRAMLNDGRWTSSALSLEQYFTDTRNAPVVLQPYTETVQEYTIDVQDGQMAFVKADATFTQEGKPARNNIDLFTLIKLNGEWKFLTIAWVGKPSLVK